MHFFRSRADRRITTHGARLSGSGPVYARGSHAGVYSPDRAHLSKELDGFLDAAGSLVSTPERSSYRTPGTHIPGPPRRGGKHVDAGAGVRRVFLLGPSHHVFLRRCALSKCAAYATPLGDLAVDRGVYELRATGHFVDMDVDVDEAEHSLELHLPYIFGFEVLPERDRPTLVPIGGRGAQHQRGWRMARSSRRT